jgi:hypothetical protein
MTSGYYPVLHKPDYISFLTTYKAFNDPPTLATKCEFTPGYQGHQTGKRYIIGQSNPAGMVHYPLSKSRIETIADIKASLPGRARSERPLGERQTSKRRSGTSNRKH